MAISSAAAGFSQSYGQLIVLRSVGGLGSSMFTVSALALLLRVVDTDQRGRASGAFQGGFLLGGVAGPAVGGLVVGLVDPRAVLRLRGDTAGRSRRRDGLPGQVAAARARATRWPRRDEGRLEQLRDALKDGAYRAAIVVNLVTGFVVFGLRASAVPLFVTEGLGRTATLAGIGFLVAAGLQAVLLLPAGRMADTQGRRAPCSSARSGRRSACSC